MDDIEAICEFEDYSAKAMCKTRSGTNSTRPPISPKKRKTLMNKEKSMDVFCSRPRGISY
jgi:hypothetical protein